MGSQQAGEFSCPVPKPVSRLFADGRSHLAGTQAIAVVSGSYAMITPKHPREVLKVLYSPTPADVSDRQRREADILQVCRDALQTTGADIHRHRSAFSGKYLVEAPDRFLQRSGHGRPVQLGIGEFLLDGFFRF